MFERKLGQLAAVHATGHTGMRALRAADARLVVQDWPAATPRAVTHCELRDNAGGFGVPNGIATAIQRKLGLKDLKVQWVAVSPSSRIPDVVDGAIDLECGSTTIIFSRMGKVDFSFLTFVDGAARARHRGLQHRRHR